MLTDSCGPLQRLNWTPLDPITIINSHLMVKFEEVSMMDAPSVLLGKKYGRLVKL